MISRYPRCLSILWRTIIRAVNVFRWGFHYFSAKVRWQLDAAGTMSRDNEHIHPNQNGLNGLRAEFRTDISVDVRPKSINSIPHYANSTRRARRASKSSTGARGRDTHTGALAACSCSNSFKQIRGWTVVEVPFSRKLRVGWRNLVDRLIGNFLYILSSGSRAFLLVSAFVRFVADHSTSKSTAFDEWTNTLLQVSAERVFNAFLSYMIIKFLVSPYTTRHKLDTRSIFISTIKRVDTSCIFANVFFPCHQLNTPVLIIEFTVSRSAKWKQFLFQRQ